MHKLTNRELAHIFREIGEYLQMEDDPFRPRAYEKAADVIDAMQKEVADLYKEGGRKALDNIPGVGESIANKIEELLKTGKLKYYQQLKKRIPVDLEALTSIEGLGPKQVKKLYKKLKIKNLNDLEKAAKAGKIATLEGFGKKSEANILKGIEFVKRSGGRHLLGRVLPIAKMLVERIGALRDVQKIDIAGSLRRRKETIGDIDILVVASNPEKIMNFFTSMPEVIRVYAKGKTKSMIRIKPGLDVDLRIIADKSYGAALNYFTGSKEHNIALRKIAIDKGYKLNEYGLFKGKKLIAGRTEEELYKQLGMDYIEPELREMTGEIEAAKNNTLPTLIKYGELKGDLQVQTNWTDGADSIEAMAKAAIDAGLSYIAITDHSKRLAMTGGLNEKDLQKQGREIDKLNKKLAKYKFKILKGVECDILKDGRLDLSDKALSKLEVVGASVHSHFNLSRHEQTKRIIRAIENPHVDILFHPTTRLINKRKAIDFDIDAVIKAAKKNKVVLEIDAFPDRLDLKDEYIRKCVKAGVKLSIDSDAHSVDHFSVLEYGIAQARRGWAEKKDIINAWPLSKMLSFLK